MPRFDEESLAAIQDFVDRSCEHFASMGLSYSVSDDMAAWADWISKQPHSHGVTKTHDPKQTHLDPGNSFWSHLQDSYGRVIACHAQRLIITDDFLDDIVTQTAFFDRVPKIRLDDLELRLETKLMRISGRVCLGGGLYIHPDWRGKGLYSVLSRTTRAISLRHFKLDWYLAYFLTTQSRTQLGLEGAAFARAIPLLSGIYPPYGRQTDIQLMTMTREEALAQIRQDNQTATGSVRYRVA
jgi:GNAT superfamily N-acetyltransferase